MRYVKKKRKNYIVDAVQVTKHGYYSKEDNLLLSGSDNILRESDHSLSVVIGGSSCCAFPGDYIVILGDSAIGILSQEVFENDFEPSKETPIGNSIFYVEDVFAGKDEVEFYAKPEADLTGDLRDEFCVLVHDIVPGKVLQLIPGGPSGIQLLNELTYDEYRKLYPRVIQWGSPIHYTLALEIFKQVTILHDTANKLIELRSVSGNPSFLGSFIEAGIKKLDNTIKKENTDV